MTISRQALYSSYYSSGPTMILWLTHSKLKLWNKENPYFPLVNMSCSCALIFWTRSLGHDLKPVCSALVELSQASVQSTSDAHQVWISLCNQQQREENPTTALTDDPDPRRRPGTAEKGPVHLPPTPAPPNGRSGAWWIGSDEGGPSFMAGVECQVWDEEGGGPG